MTCVRYIIVGSLDQNVLGRAITDLDWIIREVVALECGSNGSWIADVTFWQKFSCDLPRPWHPDSLMILSRLACRQTKIEKV